MKMKILSLFSLLALLLVSTSILADGQIVGIRITRAVFGGDNNVEIDVSVSSTSQPWDTFASTVELGNRWSSGYPGSGYGSVWQYASSQFNYPSPYAISWGDGSAIREVRLFGPSGGPWVGTFSHTYSPGSYVIRVGDSVQGQSAAQFNTGNPVTGSARYAYCAAGFCSTYFPGPGFGTFNIPTYSPVGWYSYILALTANTTVTTGTGIPTLNVYGLLAMALILVGTGVLVYRPARRTVV